MFLTIPTCDFSQLRNTACVFFPRNGSLTARISRDPRDRPVTMVDLHVESTRLTVQPVRVFFRPLCPKHPTTC